MAGFKRQLKMTSESFASCYAMTAQTSPHVQNYFFQQIFRRVPHIKKHPFRLEFSSISYAVRMFLIPYFTQNISGSPYRRFRKSNAATDYAVSFAHEYLSNILWISFTSAVLVKASSNKLRAFCGLCILSAIKRSSMLCEVGVIIPSSLLIP